MTTPAEDVTGHAHALCRPRHPFVRVRNNGVPRAPFRSAVRMRVTLAEMDRLIFSSPGGRAARDRVSKDAEAIGKHRQTSAEAARSRSSNTEVHFDSRATRQSRCDALVCQFISMSPSVQRRHSRLSQGFKREKKFISSHRIHLRHLL
jgi:hypothetical protein